ncbi:NTP transferase domain-containing protein [Jannaschia sp. W003]|uniref:nucleotidyltransferase family protein n=1 Tax=Jannaschia sp. W003 TaxID=2867012 RepID=UPI0021A79790|nr:nucleotidyltransferase family protein [Jannaschia sp. W003]UWQ20309.1 nucleotidyltransferase family protein [Jannaschia sp. W003]
MRPPPAILVLAAGASRRMRGGDKLLETVDGAPLVLRAARAALGVAAEVMVALPEGDRDRSAWLGDLAVRRLAVAERSMSASIRAGVAACRSDALMIHLADMPEIGAGELWQLSEAWRASDAPILRAGAEDGTPGHPAVFARSLFPELLALRGDRGARAVVETHPCAVHPLPGRAALTDLDTPEDWARWRATVRGAPKP